MSRRFVLSKAPFIFQDNTKPHRHQVPTQGLQIIGCILEGYDEQRSHNCHINPTNFSRGGNIQIVYKL